MCRCCRPSCWRTTTRWCASASGMKSSAAPAPRADTLFTRATRSYARSMALIRKKDFAGAPRRSIDQEDRRRSAAHRRADVDVAEPRGLGAANRCRSARGRARRRAGQLRQGDRASRPSGALRGRDDLHRAGRLASARAPQPRRRAAAGGSSCRGGKRLLGRSRAIRRTAGRCSGFSQALRAQNKTDEAKRIEADFKKAWADADVQLTASRF